MNDWMMTQLVKWLASNLTADRVKGWADMLMAMVLPVIGGYKDDLIKRLRAEAFKTDTVIDDLAVDALDLFLDALMPNKAALAAS